MYSIALFIVTACNSLYHVSVSATSDTVERLFTRAILIMTAHSRCMDPSTLEALLMLRYNRDMGDVYFDDKIVAMVQTGAALLRSYSTTWSP